MHSGKEGICSTHKLVYKKKTPLGRQSQKEYIKECLTFLFLTVPKKVSIKAFTF